jgi:hypothetical protein
MLRTSECRAKQRRDAHRLPPPGWCDTCHATGKVHQPSVANAVVGRRTTVTNPLELRRRLATRWNAVTSAGIHIGDKISVSITIGRSIVSPTFLPRSGSLRCFSARRATLRDTRPVARAIVGGATIEKIDTFFPVTTTA